MTGKAKVGATVMWCPACFAYVEWIHTCAGEHTRPPYGKGVVNATSQR